MSNHKTQGDVPYGIIDPDYARVFTMARCLAWQEGYALAMHGSFTRDLDLVAIPWTETACAPDHLVARISEAADLRIIGQPTSKPHRRLAFTMVFKGFADPRFVDLSVMPRALGDESPTLTSGHKSRTDEDITKVIDAMPKGIRGYPDSWDLYEFTRALDASGNT